jgi:hypothetical protein
VRLNIRTGEHHDLWRIPNATEKGIETGDEISSDREGMVRVGSE